MASIRVTAIQMATLNTAECYGLTNKGAIAPGYDADFLVLDDLQNIEINQVYCAGKLIAQQGQFLGKIRGCEILQHYKIV